MESTLTESNDPANIITFKTRSETDILDDGYRWKKYGQKRIKNSNYQRVYLKCKAGGCEVKKRSQRCEDDPLFVLTTYQGIHNHPANKTSSRSASSPNSTALRNSYDLRSQLLQTVENAEAPPVQTTEYTTLDSEFYMTS